MNKTTLFAFPGQGSQYLMMGKSVFDNYEVSRRVFQEVDDALGYRLSSITFGDNAEELTLTYNAQPALMCVSIAVLRAIEFETGKKIEEMCSLVCGHSLGEYSALCAAGAISVHDAAKILAIRGRAMNNAAPAGTGGMAAILGGSDDDVKALLEKSLLDGEILVVANDNSFGQTVISGSIAAIDRSIEIAKEFGIKRAVKLPVSGPFHSPLMQKAQEDMEKALSNFTITKPAIPVVANYSAKATSEPEEIRHLLVKQITGSVRWRESIQHAQEIGYTRFVEIGAGKVLNGLTKRISPNMSSMSVESKDDIMANKDLL